MKLRLDKKGFLLEIFHLQLFGISADYLLKNVTNFLLKLDLGIFLLLNDDKTIQQKKNHYSFQVCFSLQSSDIQ